MLASSPLERWLRSRTFHHADFPVERVAVERDATVSVVVPTKECASTIGPIVEALAGLREAGVIDEVVVVDADSVDGTADLARAAGGAEVVPESKLLPAFGPVLGKGDAMWRALSATSGDVVLYLDGDSSPFGAHFACGVLGPVVCEPGAQLAKATYRRPLTVGETALADGGGRVTELTAKPLLRRFWPELAGFGQPLSGEVAARRTLLEALPFATGYAAGLAMLIDAYARVGLRGLAQVDLDERRHPHQALARLGAMADAQLEIVARRLEAEGRLVDAGAAVGGVDERPPMASVRDAPSERPL